MSFATLERPSATPSMAPSHAGPAPTVARKAGNTAVAVSWLQSLNRLVRPTPRTVRLSQGCFSAASRIGGQFTARARPVPGGLCHSETLLEMREGGLLGKAEDSVGRRRSSHRP